MKTHKFDVTDAKKHGVKKAIILEHLRFHQQANEGNGQLEMNGKVWAFIKPETIEKMYPYFRYPTVNRWLRELEEEGAIESCKPQAKWGNHLKFYHVPEADEPIPQNEDSISQNEDSGISENEDSSIVTDVKTNEEKNTKKSELLDTSSIRGIYTIHSKEEYHKNQPIDFESFVDFFNECTGSSTRMTPNKKGDIKKMLKAFTGDEIKQALENRAVMLKDNEYLTSWQSIFSRKIERMEKYLTANPKRTKPTTKHHRKDGHKYKTDGVI